MNPEELFLDSIPLIERIASYIGRRNHLGDDDTSEFAAEVKYRLIEHDYAIIRKFEGRSSFSTYLTTVITRMHHQFRIEKRGKWRPSAEAKRLGDKAITLERMVSRDGLTFHEAVQILTTRCDSAYTVAELEALYVRLPTRHPRPILVSDEMTPEVATDADADERLFAREREQTARLVAMVIDRFIRSLPAEAQLILRMRFEETLKVPEIARRLQLDQKKIYKQLEKLFAIMRKTLEAAGVSQELVDDLLLRGDHEVRVGILRTGDTAGKPPFGPSHHAGGEAPEDGESRQLK